MADATPVWVLWADSTCVREGEAMTGAGRLRVKRRGVLNLQLSALLSSLGHTDRIAIGDCGLPIPEGVEIVDLAVIQGLPRFLDVLAAVTDEIVVQKVTVAFETERRNPDVWHRIEETFADASREAVDHEELKRRLMQARAVIRTGEATPYANVILECGVAF